MYKNDNPFEPWNNPMYEDDPRCPHNNPMYKDDPFKPWNEPFGSAKDLSGEERRCYGIYDKDRSYNDSYFDDLSSKM